MTNVEDPTTRNERRPEDFENPLPIRATICSAGIVGAVVVVLAHLPLVLLAVPVVILFLGILANPKETHAAWYGALNTFGVFDPSVLNNEEKELFAGNRHYFWFGEVISAAVLAGAITVPLGRFLAEKTGSMLSFTIAAMLFLLLFVFLPKLIRLGMLTDTETILELFGRNEQVKKVFWSVFIVLTGFVLTQLADPVTAQQIMAILTGTAV